MRSRSLKTHRFDYVGDRASGHWSGCERQIDNAERYSQSARGFSSYQLAGARKFERKFLDDFGQLLQRQIHRGMSHGVINNARAGHAYVDHRFGLPNAMKSTGHERIVFTGIRKADKLCASYAAFVAGSFGSLLDNYSDLAHCVHIDAGARRRDVD